ncbi:hypothetical protein BE20_55125 [Sorangium cellulosum]|nr:hypothetical protein BE20_55125 [Sorangium cellulosum]
MSAGAAIVSARSRARSRARATSSSVALRRAKQGRCVNAGAPTIAASALGPRASALRKVPARRAERVCSRQREGTAPSPRKRPRPIQRGAHAGSRRPAPRRTAPAARRRERHDQHR